MVKFNLRQRNAAKRRIASTSVSVKGCEEDPLYNDPMLIPEPDLREGRYLWYRLVGCTAGGLVLTTVMVVLVYLNSSAIRLLQFEHQFELAFQSQQQEWESYQTGAEVMASYITTEIIDHGNRPSRTGFGRMYRVLNQSLPDATFSYVKYVNDTNRDMVVTESTRFWNDVFGNNKTYYIQGSDGEGNIVSNVETLNITESWAVYYMEPTPKADRAVNFDINTWAHRRVQLVEARELMETIASAPYTSRQDSLEGIDSQTISLTTPVAQTLDFINCLIRVINLVRAAHKGILPGLRVYFYDTTSQDSASFIGGDTEVVTGEALPEGFLEQLQTLVDKERKEQSDEMIGRFAAGNREYAFVMVITDGFLPVPYYVLVLVGSLGVVATFLIAAALASNHRKHLALVRSKVENIKLRERAQAEQASRNYMAHEIRNPLAVALTSLRFLIPKRDTLHTDEDNGSQETVEADLILVESSLLCIDEVLASVIETNSLQRQNCVELSVALCSLKRDVIEPVVHMVASRAGDVSLQVECPDELWVEADATRLKQIINNLVRNSINVTNDGYVKVTAKRSTSQSENVVISVADSGPGIPENKRSQLFSPYNSGHVMETRGTGMGLRLCYLLTKAMNGTIRLDQQYRSTLPGKPGACFIIEIPLKEQAAPPSSIEVEGGVLAAAVTPSIEEGANQLPEGKIMLVVDDDPIVRKITVRSLKNCLPASWTFEVCKSGEEALEKSGKTKYDIMLIDHFMDGGISGEETIRRLRSAGVTAVLIGFSANEVRKQHLAAGANGFWLKPVPVGSEVVSSMKKLLS